MAYLVPCSASGTTSRAMAYTRASASRSARSTVLRYSSTTPTFFRLRRGHYHRRPSDWPWRRRPPLADAVTAPGWRHHYGVSPDPDPWSRPVSTPAPPTRGRPRCTSPPPSAHKVRHFAASAAVPLRRVVRSINLDHARWRRRTRSSGATVAFRARRRERLICACPLLCLRPAASSATTSGPLKTTSCSSSGEPESLRTMRTRLPRATSA